MDSKTGEYKVAITDEEGKTQNVRLSDLTKEQIHQKVESLLKSLAVLNNFLLATDFQGFLV